MVQKFLAKWVFLATAVPTFYLATAVSLAHAGEPPDRINLRLGSDSPPFRLEAQDFSKIVVANPSVVDIVALTTRSFYLRPLQSGKTDIFFYDSENIPIKSYEIEVVADVEVINKPQFGGNRYRCWETGCTFMDSTKYEMPAEVHKEVK